MPPATFSRSETKWTGNMDKERKASEPQGSWESREILSLKARKGLPFPRASRVVYKLNFWTLKKKILLKKKFLATPAYVGP